jgi:hypothetical protein
MTRRTHLLAIGSFLAWLVAQVALYWPSYTSVTDAAFVTESMVEEIATLAIWIAIWGWLTWVEQGRARLSEHTIIASIASFIDVAILNFGIPWMFFNFGWPWPVDMHNIPKAALITLTALVHLHWVTRKGVNPRLFAIWLAASVLTISLVAAYTWAKKNDHEASEKLPYSPNIYPPTFIVKPEHNLQDGLDHMWKKSWDAK